MRAEFSGSRRVYRSTPVESEVSHSLRRATDRIRAIALIRFPGAPPRTDSRCRSVAFGYKMATVYLKWHDAEISQDMRIALRCVGLPMVEMRGLEPLTPYMRSKCSTS
jgi:hypothetical protein